MALYLTEKAAAHVRAKLNKRGNGVGVRIAVKSSGCSGVAYCLEFVDTVNPDDVQFQSNGVNLFTDAKSLLYIDGTELDFVREGFNEGFKFNNPNVKHSCGCGESFSV